MSNQLLFEEQPRSIRLGGSSSHSQPSLVVTRRASRRLNSCSQGSSNARDHWSKDGSSASSSSPSSLSSHGAHLNIAPSCTSSPAKASF